MITLLNKKYTKKNHQNIDNSKDYSVKISSEFTKKDIEKSYSLETIKGTEAHYSDRYGWTLRKTSE